MGNWSINISGIGSHHNGTPEVDAEVAFKGLVGVLQAQGHKLTHAAFHFGGVDLGLNEKGLAVGFGGINVGGGTRE